MARAAEITSGVQYQFSNEAGAVAASTTRVFRILKTSASEYVNVFAVCGISIGDQHPSEPGLYCASVNAQYEGDSRMVVQATFNYRTTPIDDGGGGGSDAGQFTPDVRPPSYSISTSLYEAPLYSWGVMSGPDDGQTQAPVNPAGDLYEGISTLVPITNVTYKFFDVIDVSQFQVHAGKINSAAITFRALGTCDKHTVMFRGAQSSPTTTQYGNAYWSGFDNTFEFSYRPNAVTNYRINDAPFTGTIGWDVLVPQTGLNVKAHEPTAPSGSEITGGNKNDFGQPLDVEDDGSGGKMRIPVRLPPNTPVGRKMRACINFSSPGGGGQIQRPSAAPIPLNNDGTARSPSLKPIVHRYRVQEEIDFASIFPPRLF